MRVLRIRSDESIKIKVKDIDQPNEQESIPATTKPTIHDAIRSIREIDEKIEELLFQTKASTSTRRNRNGIKF